MFTIHILFLTFFKTVVIKSIISSYCWAKDLWRCNFAASTTERGGMCMLIHFSHVQLFVTLWTVTCQAPLSMGFSRQEYQSELPFFSSGDFPDSGIKPMSLCFLHWHTSSLPLIPSGKLRKKGVMMDCKEWSFCYVIKVKIV